MHPVVLVQSVGEGGSPWATVLHSRPSESRDRLGLLLSQGKDGITDVTLPGTEDCLEAYAFTHASLKGLGAPLPWPMVRRHCVCLALLSLGVQCNILYHVRCGDKYL
jgi:hypothetical protein